MLYFENNFITVQVAHSEYSSGAAHGMYGYTYYSFDVETGDTVSLNQLITPGSLNQLLAICKQKFKKSYERADEMLTDFYVTRNYALLRKGLLFTYQPYEMGAFAEGAMQVFVPYNELRGLLNTNSSMVQRLVKNNNTK